MFMSVSVCVSPTAFMFDILYSIIEIDVYAQNVVHHLRSSSFVLTRCNYVGMRTANPKTLGR